MATNDITGDKLISKPTTDKYASGYDLIWGKKKKPTELWTDTDEEKFDVVASNGEEL